MITNLPKTSVVQNGSLKGHPTMKRNFFSLFIIAVSFLVVGDLQGTRMQTPAPTPTPKAGMKIKSMVVTTPTPAAPPKRIKGTVAGPTSTPIRIDKGAKTGPGTTPIKIGKDQVKAAPTQTPIKVIKTQVSTPTPTVAPMKIVKTQVSTPTPTPSGKIKDPIASTTTPIRIPKDGVTTGGGRPGPINLGGPPPSSRKRIPGSNNLPPNPARNVGSDDSVSPAGSQLMVDDMYVVPSSKKLIPGRNNLPPGPASKSIILQSKGLGVDNSVAPAPPPPNTGTGNQNQNPVVSGEMPPGMNTGTAKGIGTKLLVYTKNGWGTPSTNLGGEFPSQLASGAMVNPASNNFALQWSRSQAGKEEKGNLWITHPGESLGLQAQAVTMPAGATSVDIPYSINLAPDMYELLVAGESGNSNRVKVSFGGTGTESTVDLSKTGSGGSVPPAPVQESYSIKLTRFVPGSSGAPPQLFYKIETAAATKVSGIVFEVYSEPFTNSQNLTAGSGEKGPIKLFSGKSGTINVSANSTKEHSAHLEKASDIGSPEDWNIANGKTENATFKWSVAGGPSGSEEKTLHTAWP
jgi:hypothetical protein